MGKLLYFGILSYGHQNTGIVLGNHLIEKYGNEHEIYFAVDDVWHRRLKSSNPDFHYKIYTNPMETESYQENGHTSQVILEENNSKALIKDPMVSLAEFIGPLGRKSPIEQALEALPMFFKTFEALRGLEPELNRILDEVQPDLILTDQLCAMPFICRRNIPWAMILSANPLMFGLDEIPPAFSGLKMNEQAKWVEYREKLVEPYKETWNVINDWLLQNNCRPLRENYFMYESPYFNIYCYPKELDYFKPDGIQLPGRWFQLESPIAPSLQLKKIKLPEEFERLPGKLIYFSMGSLFSSYIPMMQRILDILGQLPYKFIISKGPVGELLTVSPNCWGENFVDQKAVLNSGVELFISHGGNNSTTESFYFGVPMIILPMFGDQHDNGTRMEETGMGRSLKTFEFTKEELDKAIESILNNETLLQRWKMASIRIQNDNGMQNITKEMLRYLNKSGEIKN